MINIYGFTYPSAITKFRGYILVKVGDSIRTAQERMKEQGKSVEYEKKITVGIWNNLQYIARDYKIHKVLKRRGLHHKDGDGTEWFKIPAETVDDARLYLDEIITDLEGKKVRNKVQLRNLQQTKLDQAMNIIAKDQFEIGILAYLCPRFGKTIWSLMLFNELSKKYNNRIMLVPAYWLGVHPSFEAELDLFDDFLDIELINTNDADCMHKLQKALDNGQRAIVPISLHGDVAAWKQKHQWIADLDKNDLFVFADEGDFGTHADNQKEKMKFLLDLKPHDTVLYVGGKFVKVFASGTNIQRLAKCTNSIDGVIHTAYSQLEQSEQGIILRKFYCTEVDSLKVEVEKLDEKIMPSWSKIWDKPLANKAFIDGLFKSLVGDDTLRPELNLSNMAEGPIDCFMLLVSADKKQMSQIEDIANRAIPNWKILKLNGDVTTNRDAESEARTALNNARIENKNGLVIIANQMGSRSFSIPEIQASVIAYDRGSVDATTQKVSRCLTPGKTFKNKSKTHGVIVDLSFDPNRAENIERLILEEAIQVQRSDNIDFTSAVKFVLSSINLFKVNQYGSMVEVKEQDMFRILGDNDNLLKVADITVDIEAAVESGVFEILCNVNADGKSKHNKKTIIGEGVQNSVTESSDEQERTLSDSEKKDIEKIINNAIRALNMSATSVYHLAENGDSYRQCLDIISSHRDYNVEFKELFGIDAKDAVSLLEKKVLNEAILDVVVQNSKQLYSPFL